MMSKPNNPINNPINQSQLLSELESSSKTEDMPTIDSHQNSMDVDKFTSENVNKVGDKSYKEFLKNVDWYSIACKIRTNNRKLVQKIMELEASLQENVKKLQTQQKRCRSADNLIEQQRQELNNSQEEMGQLYHQLEKANQESQNQQIFMESLSQQLRTSQEQIARLERECSLLQEDYHQQKRKLIELEKQNRELEVRLQRQQHYTLQFKSALDQCLKASSDENIEEILEKKVALKVKEIHPWSNDQQENNNTPLSSNLHKKLLASQPIDVSKYPIQYSSTIKEENKVLEEKVVDKRENSEPKTNNSSLNHHQNQQKKEKQNKVNQEQKSKNINLPFSHDRASSSDQLVIPSKESQTNSLFLEISDSQPKNPKKRLLKLPNF